MEESDVQSSEFPGTEGCPVCTGSSSAGRSIIILSSSSSKTTGMDKFDSKDKGKTSQRISKTASLEAEYEQKFSGGKHEQ